MIKNNKIKGLLLAGILVISTFSMIGCSTKANNSTQNNNEQNTSEENKTSNEENNATNSSDESQKNNQKKDDEKNSSSSGKKSTSEKYEITYYTYDIDSEKLSEHKKNVDEISVGNVIKALISEKVLQKGTDVNKAKVEKIDGVRTLVVDVNDKFMNSNLGSGAETLMLQSFTNSLIKTFKVEQVKLTVNGENYSSGHIFIDNNEYLKYK